MPDSVNAQTIDAVTAVNVKVVAEAPAQAMGIVYQATAQSLTITMAAMTQANSGLLQIGNAVTSAGATMIMAQAPAKPAT